MQNISNSSLWDTIVSQRDVQATKLPCFPVPYTIIKAVKPYAGRRAVIPCVELRTLSNDGYMICRCDSIIKPESGETLDDYLNRFESELCSKDILGETVYVPLVNINR